MVLGSSDRITAKDLPDMLAEPAGEGDNRAGAPFHEGVRDVKRRLILEAIDRSGGNYAAAARLLGLNPTLPAPPAEEPAAQRRRGAPLVVRRTALQAL